MRRTSCVILVLVLFVFFSCVSNRPPTVPVPVFPEDGSDGIPIKTRLIWECGDPEGDRLSFDVYFGESSPTLIGTGIEVNVIDVEDLKYDTQYSWRVVAVDEHGARTPSPIWTFKTVKNLPPRIHSPVPRDGESGVNTNPRISWKVDDPESDDVYFDIYFGKEYPVLLIGGTRTDHLDLKGLDYDTEYSWRIVARDSFGNRSAGPIWKFRTVENKPPKLDYISPRLGASNQELSLILEWSARDPEGDEMGFDVFFGKTRNPDLILKGSTKTRYVVDDLSYGETYFWKIIARDTYNNVVEGPVWWFTTKANLPPELTYTSPRNGSYGISLNTHLVWKASDPENDDVLFDVYFGSDGLELIVRGITKTSVRVSGLEYDTPYKWRVVAEDSHGNVVEGPIWRFRTIVNFAPRLEYTSPLDGSSGLDTSVSLEWSGSDPEGEDISYDVYFGKEGELNQVASGLNGEIYDLVGLEYGRTYEWMIMARDEYGNEVRGPVWRFSTRENLPPMLEYSHPRNGESDVPVEVVLTWSATDPEGDDVSYNVYLGSDGDLSLIGKNLKEPEFRTSLLYGREYIWKITAIDSHGNRTEGPVWTFSTEDFPAFSKIFGGSGLDEGRALEYDSEGCVIVGYTYSNDGDVSHNRGGGDAWAIRVNGDGNMVWERTFGGNRKDVFNDVVSSGNGYVFVGYTLSDDGDVENSKGSADFWIVAVDSIGDLLWEKTFGGSGWDEAHAVCSSGSGYILVGTTKSSDGDVSRNFGGKDVWIVRIGDSGDLLWEKTFGGRGWDEAMDVVCSDDGYVVVGYTTGDTRDLLVLKLDSQGNLIWQKVLGGTGVDVANSIVRIPGSGYTVAGYTSSSDGEDAWILSLNESGDVVWSKTLGGSGNDRAQTVVLDSAGDHIVAGFSSESGEYDFYVFGVNGRGDVVWEKLLGGSSMDRAFDVFPFSKSGFIVLGTSMSDDGDVPGNRGSGDVWIVRREKPDLTF